jgi:hypothetical protein
MRTEAGIQKSSAGESEYTGMSNDAKTKCDEFLESGWTAALLWLYHR